jgi:8-oxo-dGTP diphosphatase
MPEELTEYVCGFALDYNGRRVALIRKNRPEWQAGHLNGIGGHIEEGETPWGAMVREFEEETGQLVTGWEPFVTMDFPGARIYFYRARVKDEILDNLQSVTDEQVFVTAVSNLNQFWIIPNLLWLIPLAAYTADTYETIHVVASTGECAP